MGCGDFAQFLFKSIFKSIMSEKKSAIRLSRLTIKNYKKIDYLEIDFPRPLMKGDADILVFGSKNGGGKTSVLECCSLLTLAGIFGCHFHFYYIAEFPFDIANLLVKAGLKDAIITGEFERGNKKCSVSLRIPSENSENWDYMEANFNGDISVFEPLRSNDNKLNYKEITNSLSSILAFSNEPLIKPPLLHFNSYRKTQEAHPELGMIAGDSVRAGRFTDFYDPISSFKLEVLRALMGQASLFEGLKQDESQSVLSKLNELIRRYCEGEIEQLRLLPDNKVDIRIKLSNGNESFSFDGLSSGQKEMIATLFLIWKNTQNQPSIVLIDEPELHLNAEWQSGFVRQLHKLAPNNQYILATHSETIFRSVDRNHRGLLDSNDNGVK